MRQGNVKVVTVVRLKGTVASGFWSPALTGPPGVCAAAHTIVAITNWTMRTVRSLVIAGF